MPKNVVKMPMELLRAPIGAVDVEARTVSVVWLSGEQIKRYDWMRDRHFMLRFSKEPGACRMGRLASGTAPVLNAHNQWTLEAQIGVVTRGDYKGGTGTAALRFSKREDVEPIWQDVQDKIICNVSAGINLHRVEVLPPDDKSEGLPVYLATDFEPAEISLVPIGADSGAGVLADHKQRVNLCEMIDLTADAAATLTGDHSMPAPNGNTQGAAAQPAAAAEQPNAALAAAPSAVADPAALRAEATAAERARVKLIDDLCGRHQLAADFRQKLIDDGAAPEQVRERVLEKLAEKTTAIRGASYGDVQVIGDERVTRRENMAGAIFHRIAPDTKLADGARPFRHMSLLRLAEEALTLEGVNVRGRSRLEIATLSMMSTSDFPNILADVANKRLRQAYEENVPSYARWARRAPNAPDFKNINVTQLSAAPSLAKVLEGGEFTYGSMSDGKETYAIATYGKIIALTRQAIINDDLSAFDRIPRAFSGSARRLENYTVYQILLANGAMADGVALFHANHGNLPSAADIDQTNLGLARALMRKQTGLQGEKLNLAPRWLLAGPDKEQKAYQFTSSQYVPAKPADVNEFRAGGRTALEPVIDNEIDGNKWFLAADNMQVDTVEYCYLDGSEGVFLESQIGFKIDGIEVKARLDFAAKAVDHRGLVYNSGA